MAFWTRPARYRASVASVALLTVLAGCDSWVSKTTPETLGTLRSSGLSEEDRVKTQERLAKTLEKVDFGELPAPGGLGADNPTGLAALTGLTLEQNPTIGRAAQAINRADAARLNAVFGYLPQVSLTFQQDTLDQEVVESDNAVFSLGTANYDVSVQTLEIRQPILDVSRIFGIRVAKTAQTLAEVNYIEAVRDVTAELFDTYVVALQAQSRAQALRDRLALLDRQIAGLQTQAETGVAGVVEVASVRGDRAALAAEAAFEEARLAEALGTLSRLSGQVVTQLPAADLPALSNARALPSVDEAVALGLRENPAVMAAALQVVVSRFEDRQQVATDFAPVLTAYARLEDEDRGDSRFGGGSVTNDQTVGIQLSIPIFNANGQGYGSLVSGVDERLAVQDYHSLRAGLEAEIRALHARFGALSEALSSAQGSVTEATNAQRRERDRVSSGQSLPLAELALQVRVNQTQERADHYRAELLRTWARLQYLTGADLSASVQ